MTDPTASPDAPAPGSPAADAAARSHADTVQDPAISLRGVAKSFGAIRAVDGVDLEVPSGSCFGLLGPNGAGKSTTMKLLTAQALPDAGELEVLGLPLPSASKRARARCGVVPQLDNLDVELTARQNLAVFARLYRVPRSERRAAVDRALAIANLVERADTRVDALSGGMRRRLLIARALVHGPELVLMDEPTVGLDPQVRQELWGLITRLRQQAVTVLMSTHYIEEAERLTDRVAMMAAGKVVADDTPPALIEQHAGQQVLEVYGPPERLDALAARATAAGHPTRRSGPALVVLFAERLTAELAGELTPTAVRRAANLEDVFVRLTGEEIA
ncbi:ABC transporter ATP-binding protein [Egibacter rhizosphaerae]|uniref:ABC transporter ATP-binding protein n=1 Tax=Egibacter rhizosphaerae TaxID=1670831 RepID=A0A411YKG7_9ACTN|nr:ABC transporter ATP-binding protein [Egibacter rhizosphaerae]QBI21671.1 ABC transporter ATP-binding protein [Egibacter rhizosphaerae]